MSKAPTRASSARGHRLAVCIATAKSGKRCKCPPMRGTRYCPMHTPGVASKLGEKGGRRRAIFNPDGLEHFAAPTCVRDQIKILAQLQVETHTGKLDPKVASTISTLANAFVSCLELEQFGEKIKAMEARLGLLDPTETLSPQRDVQSGRFLPQ